MEKLIIVLKPYYRFGLHDDGSPTNINRLQTLIVLYVFADKYSVLDLRRHVVDYVMFCCIISRDRGGIVELFVDIIESLYSSTRPKCGLRRLVVDWILSEARDFDLSSQFKTIVERLPELAADLAVSSLTHMRRQEAFHPSTSDVKMYYD